MDIVHLSETYLDSSIQSDNYNLENPGYNVVRFDHPSNYKRGGVSKYGKHLCLLESSISVFCINA